MDTNEEVDVEKSGGRERQGDQKKRKKTSVLKQTRSKVDMENEKMANRRKVKAELTRPLLFS